MKYIIVCFQSVGIWSGWIKHENESHGLDKWLLGWLLFGSWKDDMAFEFGKEIVIF